MNIEHSTCWLFLLSLCVSFWMNRISCIKMQFVRSFSLREHPFLCSTSKCDCKLCHTTLESIWSVCNTLFVKNSRKCVDSCGHCNTFILHCQARMASVKTKCFSIVNKIALKKNKPSQNHTNNQTNKPNLISPFCHFSLSLSLPHFSIAKKASRYIIAAILGAMAIVGPLGLKAIAAIAAKALLISKIALTIASIIALKKIYSSDPPRETQIQVFADDHRRIGRPARYRSSSIKRKSTDPYRHYSERQ